MIPNNNNTNNNNGMMNSKSTSALLNRLRPQNENIGMVQKGLNTMQPKSMTISQSTPQLPYPPEATQASSKVSKLRSDISQGNVLMSKTLSASPSAVLLSPNAQVRSQYNQFLPTSPQASPTTSHTNRGMTRGATHPEIEASKYDLDEEEGVIDVDTKITVHKNTSKRKRTASSNVTSAKRLKESTTAAAKNKPPNEKNPNREKNGKVIPARKGNSLHQVGNDGIVSEDLIKSFDPDDVGLQLDESSFLEFLLLLNRKLQQSLPALGFPEDFIDVVKAKMNAQVNVRNGVLAQFMLYPSHVRLILTIIKSNEEAELEIKYSFFPLGSFTETTEAIVVFTKKPTFSLKNILLQSLPFSLEGIAKGEKGEYVLSQFLPLFNVLVSIPSNSPTAGLPLLIDKTMLQNLMTVGMIPFESLPDYAELFEFPVISEEFWNHYKSGSKARTTDQLFDVASRQSSLPKSLPGGVWDGGQLEASNFRSSYTTDTSSAFHLRRVNLVFDKVTTIIRETLFGGNSKMMEEQSQSHQNLLSLIRRLVYWKFRLSGHALNEQGEIQPLLQRFIMKVLADVGYAEVRVVPAQRIPLSCKLEMRKSRTSTQKRLVDVNGFTDLMISGKFEKSSVSTSSSSSSSDKAVSVPSTTEILSSLKVIVEVKTAFGPLFHRDPSQPKDQLLLELLMIEEEMKGLPSLGLLSDLFCISLGVKEKKNANQFLISPRYFEANEFVQIIYLVIALSVKKRKIAWNKIGTIGTVGNEDTNDDDKEIDKSKEPHNPKRKSKSSDQINRAPGAKGHSGRNHAMNLHAFDEQIQLQEDINWGYRLSEKLLGFQGLRMEDLENQQPNVGSFDKPLQAWLKSK